MAPRMLKEQQNCDKLFPRYALIRGMKLATLIGGMGQVAVHASLSPECNTGRKFLAFKRLGIYRES